MKVAVLSAVATCGKSTTISILGGVYSRSQGRDVVIFNTGDATDNLEIVSRYERNGSLDNPHIVKSMIDTAGEDSSSLLNYGTQAGDEHVYIYDVMNAAMSIREKEEFLIAAIRKVPADLTLVEISGNPCSDLNKKVLNECDCSIVLCGTTNKDCRRLVKLIESLPNCKAKINRAIVMSKYDAAVCSDKRFAEKLGLKVHQIFKFPYNPQAAKLAFNGELDRICYSIISGDYEVVNFRKPCQDLMEFLFDSETRKVIRSIDRWYK